MKRLQAFKFELQQDWEEESFMRQFAGACRFVFNKALAIQKENYEAGNKLLAMYQWQNSSLSGEIAQKHPGLKKLPAIPYNML